MINIFIFNSLNRDLKLKKFLELKFSYLFKPFASFSITEYCTYLVLDFCTLGIYLLTLNLSIMRKFYAFTWCFLLSLIITIEAVAQPQPTIPRPYLDPYVSGFDSITDIASAGDARLFVVEQQGQIMIIDGNGNLLPDPFLDIHHLLALNHNERGLLGLTFDPDYATNGYFYVNYTAAPNGETHISRFQVSADPNVADPASEVLILSQSQPFGNHNAGKINFGADGYLYIPLGDGGAGGDPLENAQDGSTWLGKMLRIDVSTLPYTIPADNPFLSDPAVLDEIWAMGLRNPYRFSFDRMTGDMWLPDVGQNMWEEVNFEAAGSAGGNNWGWDCFEGNAIFEPVGCGPASSYDFPIFTYPHENPDGTPTGHCTVIGGYVYRGDDYPVMQGHYILGDFCSGNIWTISADGSGGWNSNEQLSTNMFDLTTFGEGYDGELYAGGRQGTVYRVMDISCQNNKVKICHTKGKNPKTLCIGFDEIAIQDHLDHGDQLGPCDGSSSKWAPEASVDVRVAPNPFSDYASIWVEVPVDQKIKVDLFDLTGSKVLHIYEGNLNAGTPYSYTISNANLAEGAYILRIQGLDFTNNYKMILNK